MGMKNDHDFNAYFVSLIRSQEVLYNPAKKFVSKVEQEEIWRDIARKMGIRPEECKYRWRSLRVSFIRQLRANALGHSQAAKKQYYLTEEMKFLIPHVKLRSVGSADDSQIVDNDYDDDCIITDDIDDITLDYESSINIKREAESPLMDHVGADALAVKRMRLSELCNSADENIDRTSSSSSYPKTATNIRNWFEKVEATNSTETIDSTEDERLEAAEAKTGVRFEAIESSRNKRRKIIESSPVYSGDMRSNLMPMTMLTTSYQIDEASAENNTQMEIASRPMSSAQAPSVSVQTSSLDTRCCQHLSDQMEDSDWLFLKSLFADLKQLSTKQKRKYKQRALQLFDEVLDE